MPHDAASITKTPHMKLKPLTFLLSLLTLISCTSFQNEGNSNTSDSASSQEETAESLELHGVYFENLLDGDYIRSPAVIKMGVSGMDVEPAGTVTEGMGHHHIIVDGGYVGKDLPVANDATHFDYGKGQTSDTLALSRGRHTLTLQFANGVHSSYGADWSRTISVTVVQSN